MNDYNKEWDDERHKKIEEEFVNVWKKLDKFDIRLWGILVLQIAIVVLIVKFSG